MHISLRNRVEPEADHLRLQLEKNGKELQHALVLQQQEDTAAIRRSVGDRDRCALRHRIPALEFIRLTPRGN